MEYIITNEESGVRLDKFLSGRGFSRSAAQKLIAQGNVEIGGETRGKKYIIKQGDIVTVDEPEPEEYGAEPENIKLDIVYEDGHLLVVNKPRGMVVHPAPGHREGTLVNALMYHCKGGLSGINGVMRPGIVHRIDKDTSGLLIVAKTDAAHAGLAAQIKAHSFYREYEAIVEGRLKNERSEITGPIGRSEKDRKKMAVTAKNSKEASTCYEVIAQYEDCCHITCVLKTGRTHQIRVHMASIGHPVLGDAVYGRADKKFGLEGQCLHAKKIGFIHPVTGQSLEFDNPLPEYFQNILTQLRK